MVWNPKEPQYKPKPPKPNNTPTNIPTDVSEGGNKMTRDEAIKMLRLMKYKYLIQIGSIFDTALDMAIEALKREDTMLKEIERVVLYGERSEE